MRISTSYTLKKSVINGAFTPPEWVLKHEKTIFPYISYYDVQCGIKIEEKNFNSTQNVIGIKLKVFKYICDLLVKIFPNRSAVGLGVGVPIDYKVYFKLLIKFNLVFLQCDRISIEKADEQINIINNGVDSIIGSSEKNNNVEKFKNIINKHLKSYLEYNEPIKNNKKYKFILIGAPSESVNRVNSILAKKDKTPVITFMHGGGDQTMYDEPRIGYCESSFVDYIIGYGKAGIDYENSSYVRGFTIPPKFIKSSSSFISKIYKTGKVNTINKISDCKWMYVPDSGQLINQHGPYAGSINVLVYFKWQKQIIERFPGLFYKKHPKGDPLFRAISDESMAKLIGINLKDINIVTDNFTDAYNICDGFIFDTVSTAFMIAVATDKPIIYFNIGKRKLTKDAEKMIKERCLWVDIIDGDDIDMKNIDKLLSAKQFTNNITNKYSLAKDINETPQDAFLSLINTL